MEDFSQYNGEGTPLRKIQLRLIEMLVEIDKICRNHNIQYWIDFGTLLGAVRHGGFIPWDDDLDIALPTSDYLKFLEIAPKELPQWLFLQTKTSDPEFYRDLVRVRDKNSLYIMPGEDFSKNYKKGIFIDLLEIQPYPSISPKFQKFFFHKWYRKVTCFRNGKQWLTPKNIIASITFPIIKLGLDITWFLLCIGKKDKLSYRKDINYYGNSYTEDMIFPLKDISFEGHTFLGPADPNRYLTSVYGDYMKIPPKEKRRTHFVHVEFFE